mmetsp:Transcript_11006/g.20720  ORF Transcript_11006/g.20720 Transcript_11006/m.20720 type:complete len:280 (+) Transcript_11006:101-940(+)
MLTRKRNQNSHIIRVWVYIRLYLLFRNFTRILSLHLRKLLSVRLTGDLREKLLWLLKLHWQRRIHASQLLRRGDGAVLHPGGRQHVHGGRELLVHHGGLPRERREVEGWLFSHGPVLLHLGFPLGLFHGLRLTMALGILLGHILHLQLRLLLDLGQVGLGNLLLHGFLFLGLLLLFPEPFLLLLLFLGHLSQLNHLRKRLLAPHEDLREALAALGHPGPKNPLILVHGQAPQSIWAKHVAGLPERRLAPQEDPTCLHKEEVEGDLPTEGHRLRAVVPEI